MPISKNNLNFSTTYQWIEVNFFQFSVDTNPFICRKKNMESFIINHWAVWICAILNLVLGALWYSPALFFNSWKKENGLTDEQLKNMKPMKVYGLAFIPVSYTHLDVYKRQLVARLVSPSLGNPFSYSSFPSFNTSSEILPRLK